MPDPTRDPRLGDTLGPSPAGRVDPDVGATQGGTPSHERPSYADPITVPRSDTGDAADRVPGAASTTPELPESADGERRAGEGAAGPHRAERLRDDHPAPMRGTGTPVRRVRPDDR